MTTDPSDRGGRSMWPKVLKITGIGCAVLIFVGVVLTAIGVFQVASCCSQLQDLGATADRAEREAYEFALALHEADYSRAHQMLDQSVRDHLSVAELAEHFDQWRPYFDASEPFPVLFSLDDEMFDISTMGDSSRWFARTWYATAPGSDRYLELHVVLEYERDGDDELKAGIVAWEVGTAEGAMDQAPYAMAASTFHQALRRGDFERLINHVYPGGQLPWPDSAELATELGQLSQALGQMDPGAIWAVIPVDKTLLTVRYRVHDGEGRAHMIDYQVVAADNRIYDLSPLRPADEVVGVDEEGQIIGATGEAVDRDREGSTEPAVQ